MGVFWRASILHPVIVTLICMFASTMCDNVEFTSVESDGATCPAATPVSSARSDIECAVACTGNPNCRSFGHAVPFVEGSCLVSEMDNCTLVRGGKTYRKTSGTLATGTTVMFMQRYVGDVSFAKPWSDYENGFGNSNGDFWLGLRNIKTLLGSASATWRIDMNLWNGNSIFAEYIGFTVGDSSANYLMSYAEMGNKSPTVINNPIPKNVSFSTMDRDNDSFGGSCSQLYSGNGGFWFGGCGGAHLTAAIPTSANIGASFTRWEIETGVWISLKEIRMYLKR